MLDPATKVFGIGLSKTGTSSLDRALNDLGIDSIHFPHDPQTLRELAAGNYRLSVLQRHQAVTDITVAPFYPQLDAAYPGAKFVLTVRESEAWYRSIESHWAFMREWAARDDHFRRFSEYITACVYGAHDCQRDRFLYVYREHEAAVRRYFAGRDEDLLVIDVCAGEGWEKLCPFLGFETPNRPFPHANRKEEKEEQAVWIHRLDEAAAEFREARLGDAPYVLVDGNQLAGSELDLAGRVRRIVEREGDYWGEPEDSRQAIAELESLRAEGARFAVIAWPAAWWLDHYEDFAEHLGSLYRRCYSGKRIAVYDLRARQPAEN